MGLKTHQSILKKVVTATVVGFFILIAYFYYAMQMQKNQELSTHLDDNIEMLSKEISSNITIRTSWMITVLQHIQHSSDGESLVPLFIEQDRKGLYQSANKLYQNLKQRNHITHMYFMDMQRSVVLRMHQPERFGDVIGRGTVREAEDSGRAASGVELGPLGTLTLRVVMPWFYQGKRIGYLELGLEMEDILHEIESNSPFHIILMLHKSLLNNRDWQEGQSMLNRTNDWTLFEQYTMAFPPEGVEGISAAVTDYMDSAGKPKPYMHDVGGVMYGMRHVAFSDASGDKIGKLILLLDVSMENSDLRIGMRSMIAVLFLITILIVMLLALIISRAEKARNRAESKLKLASEAIANTVEGIIITDHDGTIIQVNQAFEQVTGYHRDEVIGKNPKVLQSGCQDRIFYQKMWQSIDENGAWNGRVVNRRKNGDLYPERLSITAIKDANSNVTNYIGIFSDSGESEMLEQRFHETDKMASLRTLIGGIAHEFNNMLAGMTGNLYLVRAEVQSFPNAVERLIHIEEIAFQASDIIRRLLAFSSQEMISKSMVEIVPLIRQAMDLSQKDLPEHIQMKMHTSNEALVLEVDKSQVVQIMVNLLSNAADAVSDVSEPEIIVSVDQCFVDENFLLRHPDTISISMIKLTVSDNGCGIADKNKENIFDPFFTTKDVGDGPGLGLSMAYGAMKYYGGAIEVETSLDLGTKMHLYFPMYKQEQAGLIPDENGIVYGDGETVLLVDDDALVRDTAYRVLGKLGYQVELASDGHEAVSQYREKQHEIDLVMLDVMMPVMGGIDAALAIRNINPDVKLLFVTGYDVRKKLKQKISISGDLVLNKPYNIKKLSYVLREVLYPGDD